MDTSDDILRFVATDPEVLPKEAKTPAAQHAVAACFPAATVAVERYGHVAFIDNGANLESVRCASCGADLLDDGRWTGLMDSAWSSGMTQRRFDMACCGTSLALEELDYDWPVGSAPILLRSSWTVCPGGIFWDTVRPFKFVRCLGMDRGLLTRLN